MRRVLVLLTAALPVVLWLPRAAAAAAPVPVRIEYGFAGAHHVYGGAPLIVRGRAAGALRARVEVVFHAGRGRRRTGRATFTVTTPGPFARVFLASGPGRPIAVRVTGGARGTRAIGRSGLFGESEIVGALTDRPIPRVVAMTGVSRRARVVRLSPAHLASGLPVLRSLTHLVIDGGAAGALSAEARRAIVTFGSSGGSVILAGAMPRLEPLPGAWASAPREPVRVPFGTGVVTRMPGPMSDRSWSASGPAWSAAIAALPVDEYIGRPSLSVQSLVAAMVEGSALGARRPWFVLPMLLLSVVLIGPLNLVVLRLRRRLDAAWVTAPALAVCCTLVVTAVGAVWQAQPLAGRMEIDAAFDGLDLTLRSVARVSRFGERHTIALSDGLRGEVVEESSTFVDAWGGEAPVRVTAVDEGVPTAIVGGRAGFATGLVGARFAGAPSSAAGTIEIDDEGFAVTFAPGLGRLEKAQVIGFGRYAVLGSASGGTKRAGRWRNRPSTWPVNGPHGGHMSPVFYDLLGTDLGERVLVAGVRPGMPRGTRRFVIAELRVRRARGSAVVAQRNQIGEGSEVAVMRFSLPPGARVGALTLDGILPNCEAMALRAQRRCHAVTGQHMAMPVGRPAPDRRALRSRDDPLVEVRDIVARRWVRVRPSEQRASLDARRVVSPLGEILVRIRGAASARVARTLWLTGTVA